MSVKPSALDDRPVEPLTPREHDVLLLLAQHLRYQDIAERLTIAISSVKWYAQQIYGKLGAENRRDAILRARALGILAAEEASSSAPPAHASLPPAWPSGTVTFLFTDIQDSTPLWEKMPEAMQAAVDQHHNLMRRAIETNGGFVFQVIGDAFQAAFRLASAAIRAALESQRLLREAQWGPTGLLKVRMGLHTGPAELDTNYFAPYKVSHTLNRSARVMSAGYGGQILLSQETAALVLSDIAEHKLPDGVTLKDLGQHRLKGMERLEHLYQVVAPDLPQDFPPLPTAQTGTLLQLWLLGEFRAESNHQPIQALDSPRLQSFFAYLVLHHKTPIAKQQLAGLFWPDTDENQARTNLRRLIFRLRRAWSGFDQYVTNTGNSLQWNPSLPFWCDVFQVQQSVQEAKKVFSEVERYELLEKAVALCKGDLFPGCYDDWIIPDREACHNVYISAVEDLIQIAEARGNYDAGIRFAEQLRSRDPLYEPAYLALMRFHMQNGNRAGALEVYQQCCTVFQEEIQSTPGNDIESLYQSILHLDSVSGHRKEAHESLPFIGRDAEWDQLRQAWIRAGSTPHMIIIHGETGIGKSRLAEEFAKWVQSQGHDTSTTRCYANEGSITYAPVVSWLSAAYQKQKAALEPARLRELARILPNILREYPTMEPPLPMTESWQRLQFFAMMAQTLLPARSRLPRSDLAHPLLLIIDDLQWCDSETLEWLHYLLRFDPARPLLIIGTCRVEEFDPHSALEQFIQRVRSEGKLQEIELTGLNQKGSSSLAAHILAKSLDEVTAKRLFSNTSGNPLFIVEVARAWAAHQPELSARLQGIIASRLAQFSGAEAEVIDVTATIGREIHWDLLSIATHLPEEQLTQSLDVLFGKRIFREQGIGTYDFIHDQIREVAYQRISIPRRRILHRRVAEAIIKICTDAQPASDHLLNVNAAQIASHYEQAGSPYQAFQFYARAAEYADKVYAHQVSESLYTSAIRLARQLNWPGQQLARLYASQGRALEHLGRFPEAIQVYTDLELLARERNDAEMQCVALARMAACYNEPSGVHDPAAAKPLLSKGLAIAKAISAYELEGQMEWSLLVYATHYGKPGEGREAAEACLSVARSHNLKDLLAVCLHDYALNLRMGGDIPYGTACAEEARAIFRADGNLSMLVDSLNQQAWIDFHQLNFQSARKYVLEAAQISRSIQNSWNLAYAAWLQGSLSEAEGKWADAQGFWEESIATGQEAGFLMSLTTVKLYYGDLLRRSGQLEKAMQLHQEALDTSQQQASFMLFASQAQMASDYLAAGDRKTGERFLQEALASEMVGVIGPCIGLPFVSNALAEWAAQSGEWQAAIQSIQPILAEAKRRNLPYDHLQVNFDFGRCLKGSGQADEAEKVFRAILPEAEKSQFHRLTRSLNTVLAALRASSFPS